MVPNFILANTSTLISFVDIGSIGPPLNPSDSPTQPVLRDDYQYPEQIGCTILMSFYLVLILFSLYNMVLSILAKKITHSLKLLFINFLIGVHACSMILLLLSLSD